MPNPPRTAVLPFPKMSQANPRRGAVLIPALGKVSGSALPNTVPLLISPEPATTAPIQGLGRSSPVNGFRATRLAPVQGNTPLAQSGCQSWTALAGFHAFGSNQPMSRPVSLATPM